MLLLGVVEWVGDDDSATVQAGGQDEWIVQDPVDHCLRFRRPPGGQGFFSAQEDVGVFELVGEVAVQILALCVLTSDTPADAFLRDRT